MTHENPDAAMQAESANAADRQPRRIGRDIWNFTPCTRVPSEAEIMARWQGDLEKPVVSIICNTYNHRDFIEDAVAGFLIQETSFPFEILIHDDASTDGTQDVIKALHADYPNLIKPLYQSENQYSQGKKPWMFQEPRAKGKYIAFCEGDDFWTDPTKLEKQVEVLEREPEVVITGHDCITVSEYGQVLHPSRYNGLDVSCSAESLLKGNCRISTLSICYRNVSHGAAPERPYVLNGDRFLFSLLGKYGSYKYLHSIRPGVYRVHEGGVWSTLKENHRIEARRNTFFWLAAHYKARNMANIAKEWEKKYMAASLKSGAAPGFIGHLYCSFNIAARAYRKLFRLSRRLVRLFC